MKPILKKSFYYIRHGQTDANAQSLMCGGQWDIDLNEAGRKQAEQAKQLVERLSLPINRLCVSPMKRAIDTAKCLNQVLNAPMETVEELKEWCVGDWDRQHWDDVPNPFNTTEDPPGGETREEFEERVVKAVNYCLEKYKDDNILIVAHGAVAHSLFTCMGTDQPMIDNATIYHLTPDHHHWSIEKV